MHVSYVIETMRFYNENVWDTNIILVIDSCLEIEFGKVKVGLSGGMLHSH